MGNKILAVTFGDVNVRGCVDCSSKMWCGTQERVHCVGESRPICFLIVGVTWSGLVLDECFLFFGESKCKCNWEMV